MEKKWWYRYRSSRFQKVIPIFDALWNYEKNNQETQNRIERRDDFVWCIDV